MEENVCSSEANKVSALLKILNSSGSSTDMIGKLRAADPNWAETLKGTEALKEEPEKRPPDPAPASKSERTASPGKDPRPLLAVSKPLNVGKRVQFPGGTITRLSKSIDDMEQVEKLKNVDCSAYEDCLDRAIGFGWPGFSCSNCENF